MKPASFLRQAFLMVLLAFAAVSPAHAQTAPAQTIWRLLDYIAVDYSGAVAQGRVINETEYVEMVEFSASVRQRLAAAAQSVVTKTRSQGFSFGVQPMRLVGKTGPVLRWHGTLSDGCPAKAARSNGASKS